MKTLRIFGLCMLLCASSAYAKDNTKQEDKLITIEQVRRSWSYHYQGEQLKLADLMSVLKTNEQTSLMIDPLYRRYRTALIPTYVGAGLMIVGSTVMAVSSLRDLGDPFSGGSMLGVGTTLLGCTFVLVALPFVRRYDRQLHSIVLLYNDDLVQNTSNSHSVKLGFTNNGFGVIIEF